MSALLRILVVIPLGYVLACLAAGLVIALSIYGFVDEPSPVMQGMAVAFGFVAATCAGAFAAVPMLVAIVLAEAFRWRSFFFWAPFGGVLGLVGKALAERGETVQTPGVVALYIAAGLVGGATYWLIAGRGSGAFVTRRPTAQVN